MELDKEKQKTPKTNKPQLIYGYLYKFVCGLDLGLFGFFLNGLLHHNFDKA